MTPERELLRVLADLTKGAAITMSHVLAARALLAQPESPQQAVPAGCVECMQEASEVLSEERMPRGPLADELWGFSLMLRDNAAQATQQAVLDAYTRCAEIATHFKTLRAKEWRDKYGLGNGITIEAAILAARDALKDKP